MRKCLLIVKQIWCW